MVCFYHRKDDKNSLSILTADKVVLEMLRRESVKGGLGKVYEYTGPGTETLEVPQRATIANMGATASIFPADAQVRGDVYQELLPDADAIYDEVIELDMSQLVPMMACPHLPDNVKPLTQVPKKRVQQVFIGSCTNASYADIAKAALVFRGRHVHDDVSCTCGIASARHRLPTAWPYAPPTAISRAVPAIPPPRSIWFLQKVPLPRR